MSRSSFDATDWTRRFARAVDALAFSRPVAHVYNPLVYAETAHVAYLGRARPGCRMLLLGMNPGPWGMVQTGVPFGEVAAVRDWLGIPPSAIRPPARQHPQRPVHGLSCTRSEVSGRRLWGWIRERYGTPEAFFQAGFVANYCPLAFLEDGGRNRTPDRLPSDERDRLFKICDHFLKGLADYIRPEWVIGVGGFAAERARGALAGMDVRIGQILHPSPASPAANRGWREAVESRLSEMNSL